MRFVRGSMWLLEVDVPGGGERRRVMAEPFHVVEIDDTAQLDLITSITSLCGDTVHYVDDQTIGTIGACERCRELSHT